MPKHWLLSSYSPKKKKSELLPAIEQHLEAMALGENIFLKLVPKEAERIVAHWGRNPTRVIYRDFLSLWKRHLPWRPRWGKTETTQHYMIQNFENHTTLPESPTTKKPCFLFFDVNTKVLGTTNTSARCRRNTDHPCKMSSIYRVFFARSRPPAEVIWGIGRSS